MSRFVWKFVYRESDRSIRVWNDNKLFTTISAGNDRGYALPNSEVLAIVQKWLDDKEMCDVEYKVFVEIH